MSRTSSALPWVSDGPMSAACAHSMHPALVLARHKYPLPSSRQWIWLGLCSLDEVPGVGPFPGSFINLAMVTARCLAPSLGSEMLSSAEQPWFSVVTLRCAHQLEKSPPEDGLRQRTPM